MDDTPVHEALREALVNTLIHADYSGRVSVLVVKRPDMFGFRNPGRMRIPPGLAVQGGNSDCRNRRLQTMFQLVGYGDHAGSGLPKIYRNWAGQHWREPLLHELPEPEQTLMELRMSSLVPEQALAQLEEHLGLRFRALPETARLALITSQVEGQISHDRLKQISVDHPADLTKQLSSLVRERLLLREGAGRGTVYHLPWQRQPPTTVFDLTDQAQATPERVPVPPELGTVPPELGTVPPELVGEAPDAVTYLAWADVPEALQFSLTELAKPVSTSRRTSADVLRVVVCELCTGRYLGRHVLAHLLQRNADDLLKRTLKPMVNAGQLTPAYVAASDPRQAYTASTMASNEPAR